jgi:hypothetical protein
MFGSLDFVKLGCCEVWMFFVISILKTFEPFGLGFAVNF